MKNNYQFAEFIISLLIIIAISSILIITLTPYGTATTPDSISYLEAAKNINAGNGLVLSNNDIDAENQYIPLTIHPPLYSLVLSISTASNTKDVVAASWLAILTLSISGLFMFLLLRPVIGSHIAILATLVFLTASPILTVFTYAWSESLFISILLFSFWCFIKSIEAIHSESFRQQTVYLFLLATGLAMLVYCRYIGVVFIILLLPPAWELYKNQKSWGLNYSIVVLWYLIIISALFIRNYYLIGNFSGGVRGESTKNIAENMTDLTNAIFAFLPNSFFLILLAILLACGITYFKWRSNRVVDNSNHLPKYTNYLFWISIISCVSYLAFLILLRTMKNFDALDTRLISLAFPFLIIILFILACKVWKPNHWIGLPLLASSITLIIMILFQGILTYQNTLINWKQNGSPNLLVNINHKYNNFTVPSNRNLLKHIVSSLDNVKTGTVLVERPRVFTFMTKIKAKQFPSTTITNEQISKINSIKNGMIILISADSINRLKTYYKGKVKLPVMTEYLKFNIFVVPLPLPII